jgi:hypothetical protein
LTEDDADQHATRAEPVEQDAGDGYRQQTGDRPRGREQTHDR